MADNYTLKNGFTTIQRGDGAVWIDRTKGVEDVDPGWYMKGGVRAPDTDTAPAPPTPPAGSGVQGTGIPAGMTKYTLKNNIDTFQRGDGAVWIDHTKGVPDAQPGWYYKGGHRAPDTDAAPFTPNQGIAQGMGLQGAAQGPSSPYTPAQIPAGALSSNPIADWALRKAVATPTGQAVGDVATQAALIPGRTVGRAVSDVAGLGYLASAQAKAHPILGRALRVATQMTPEQMQQGAQTIQEYERPFLETELQPTTTAGEWTKKGGELAGMAGEAALLGPAAAAAYGLQGAGARATAIQGKATPNQMLAETGLSGLTNFALAQFMPAGKLPTPQAGALWQFAKDLAMQGSKGAAAGAAMGVGENLISKIHDPNAPIFTKDVGQNALQFAGFEMGHTLLKLPVYQDIASQRRAVLDHPEGPAGVSADATRMIDAVNAAKDNGLVDPESAQGHIDTLTRMKDLADRIAQTRAGKKAQAAADKAKATAEQAAAPAAEPAPAAPAAPTPEASATPTELPTFGEDSIKAARLTDLRAMFGARGIEMPTGMGKDELKKYLLKDQETRSPKPPEEVPSAAQEGQVEEGHPGEHPGGDQVSEGEGIVRQPEGAGQEAAPVNRSGGIQEGGEVPEAVKEDIYGYPKYLADAGYENARSSYGLDLLNRAVEDLKKFHIKQIDSLSSVDEATKSRLRKEVLNERSAEWEGHPERSILGDYEGLSPEDRDKIDLSRLNGEPLRLATAISLRDHLKDLNSILAYKNGVGDRESLEKDIASRHMARGYGEVESENFAREIIDSWRSTRLSNTAATIGALKRLIMGNRAIEPTDAEIMGPAPRTTTPPESVIPEEVKEANREDHEARLLQQIRPELQERFTTDLNSAKDILDNRADTVISRLTPIDAQIDRIERAFARREAKGRIPSAEEALDQNADYQRLLKERESILSDGHAAIESIHDSSAILADRYGLDKQEIRRAIMGLGSEDEGTSPTRTETGAEAGAEQRIPPTAGEPEGRATEAGLPEHADEAGVQGGIPGTEGGAGVGEAGAEAHRGAEAPEAPEAEGRAIGAAPEGTAGEGNVGAEGEAGEGGKAPDYSRPANAAKRERIAADNLGLQGLYEKGFDLVKKQLNLPEGATEMDLVHEVGNRIGKLGASVMDTARKIMATFKGIGKDMAQSLANLLHELNPFQGREGELGAVGEKRPHEQEIHDAVNEMYPGEENKALRRLIYQQGGILSAKTKELGMLRVGEFLKGASFDENGNFKVLSPKERAARVAAGIPAPIFDPTKVAKPEEAPKQLAPFMKDVADLGVQANENGVYPVGNVPTDMNANNVKLRGKDLNVLERAAAWLVPRSHILTGTMRWGRGAMYLREIPEVDKLLQTIHSLDVQQKNYGAFVKKMDELGIENHSKEIQERLQPFRDALGEAQAEYERARMNRKGNTDAIADPKFKATEKQAWFKVLAAHETVEDEMLKLAQDKKFSDARVAMLADQFDDPPDELLKLASPQEMKAAEWIKGMLDVYRSAAEREGLPVLKGSYFIHQVKEGLSSGVWDKMQEAGVKGLGLMENWQDLKIDPNAEDVRFAHRQPGGQLTLPDLYGGMGAYIEKATNLITKRQIVNKWTQAARLMDDAGYKNLANFINKDMEGYIKGYADQHYEWMDTMTRAWQMKQTALRVATAAKHTAKMPNSIVESGILNNAEAVKLLMGWDSLPKEVGDPLRQMVKTMVDASHFSRLEVGTGDVKADFARGALDKIIASGHQPVQFIEGAERAVNFAAALIDGYKRGLSPVDAMREAAGRSLLTNFSGVDQPLYARGSVGQAVGVFQGTVNKIMWLNVKRSGDIVKGLTGLMQGRELDAEEKRGLVVGLKAAVMMGAVTALSKKLDIPYDEWMREHPQVYNILLHPLKVAASSIWNAAADKDHKWNVPEADWKREIMNFQLAPIVTQTLDDYDKYGYMTAGEKLLTPAAASDWFQAKSPQTAKRYGEPGLERGIRKVTGAFKPSVKEEQEEAAGEKKEARQAAAAKKWGESWGMPGR